MELPSGLSHLSSLHVDLYSLSHSKMTGTIMQWASNPSTLLHNYQCHISCENPEDIQIIGKDFKSFLNYAQKSRRKKCNVKPSYSNAISTGCYLLWQNGYFLVLQIIPHCPLIFIYFYLSQSFLPLSLLDLNFINSLTSFLNFF